MRHRDTHQMMNGWQSRQKKKKNSDETAMEMKEVELLVRESERVRWDGRGVPHIKASSLVWKISWALWSTGAFYLLM